MILAIDQGTTGTTVMIFNPTGEILSRAYHEFSQIYPQAGWVEHDPNEIWQVTLKTINDAIKDADLNPEQIKTIGITNQRETTVLWDKRTGQPVHNAIVWQCRRSSEICQQISAAGKAPWVTAKTGLVVDAYFSATKLQWIFDHHPTIKQQALAGYIAFGTIDSWLIWNLTGGQSHVTDHTNASRTMLYNIHQHHWDQELLTLFAIPASILPEIQPSASAFGTTVAGLIGQNPIPINGVAGDQQAALFGQGCTTAGTLKNTYGTGCFILLHTGKKAVASQHGLLTTIACGPSGEPQYALEGSVFIAGAAVQWLRDEMQLISNASETQAIAESINDTAGVYVVPAFTGLGAPYWDMSARGAIVGLTRGAGKKQIVRATLEAIAYQVNDVLTVMEQGSQITINHLKVDGGACANDFLLQFQADISHKTIIRPKNIDSTALGAALLAGIGAGIWAADQLPQSSQAVDRQFEPTMAEELRKVKLDGWKMAIHKVKTDQY